MFHKVLFLPCKLIDLLSSTHYRPKFKFFVYFFSSSEFWILDTLLIPYSVYRIFSLSFIGRWKWKQIRSSDVFDRRLMLTRHHWGFKWEGVFLLWLPPPSLSLAEHISFLSVLIENQFTALLNAMYLKFVQIV